jgi:hypothetical protein
MSNATAPATVPTRARRALIDPFGPRAFYLNDLAEDMEAIHSLLGKATCDGRRAEILAMWLTIAASTRSRYQDEYIVQHKQHGTPSAPAWDGMADTEPVETAIGRWEPTR